VSKHIAHIIWGLAAACLLLCYSNPAHALQTDVIVGAHTLTCQEGVAGALYRWVAADYHQVSDENEVFYGNWWGDPNPIYDNARPEIEQLASGTGGFVKLKVRKGGYCKMGALNGVMPNEARLSGLVGITLEVEEDSTWTVSGNIQATGKFKEYRVAWDLIPKKEYQLFVKSISFQHGCQSMFTELDFGVWEQTGEDEYSLIRPLAHDIVFQDGTNLEFGGIQRQEDGSLRVTLAGKATSVELLKGHSYLLGVKMVVHVEIFTLSMYYGFSNDWYEALDADYGAYLSTWADENRWDLSVSGGVPSQ